MFDSALKIGIIVGLTFIVAMVGFRINRFHESPESLGIIGLAGYAHGYATCENKCEGDKVDPKREFHLFCENNVAYIIKWGHLKDPEVKQLKEKAELICPMIVNDEL